MTLFSPSTILIGFLLLYASSFLIFAIVHVATGISIQRIGYFSLRRITYTPREGVQIEIRGIGLSLHLPSFAQPTWVSIKVTEPRIILDPRALGRSRSRNARDQGESKSSSSQSDSSDPQSGQGEGKDRAGSRNWASMRINKVRKILQRIHRLVYWLALIDVVAANTTIHFLEAGQIQVGSLSLAVDTRLKKATRGHGFRLRKGTSHEQKPAEWIVNVHNVMLAVDGFEPAELLDNMAINIHGLLHHDDKGLRDVSTGIKVGRIYIPCDDLTALSRQVKRSMLPPKAVAPERNQKGFSVTEYVEEFDRPGSQHQAVVEKVAAYKELLSSLLRGVREIQVTLSFFRLSRCLPSLSSSERAMYLNVVSHEIGVDLHRMDQKSPSHRTYFRRDDIAHQALLATIALSISLDDGSVESDTVLYVPMATATIKTTLPSKTVSTFDDRNPEERNSNILFANVVTTSPSLDIEPTHVSRILQFMQSSTPSPRAEKSDNHRLIYRLLPKASIKVSIHEPVVRFILPIKEDTDSTDDYNLLVYSISSISMDSESSHELVEGSGVSYSLSSTYRAASYSLYYQTPSGLKYNLLTAELLEWKFLLNAAPEVYVIVWGNLNSCSAHIVNSEVNRGIRQVIEQFQTRVHPKNGQSAGQQKPSFLRRVPSWLLRVQFEATDLSLEIAEVDSQVSEISRGISLQLESWTADYRAQKYEPSLNFIRRRMPSHSTIGDASPFRMHPASPPKMSHHGATDGRRLAIHVRGLDGFVIESDEFLEHEPFFSLPRLEVALSTSSDRGVPTFYINSVIKGVYLHYSLYRYYCIHLALSVLRDAFVGRPGTQASTSQPSNEPEEGDRVGYPNKKVELMTIDVRASVVQLKATMPSDPPMLLQIYRLEVGRHRLSSPFARASIVRLHSEAPKLRGVWARIASLTKVKLDLRKVRFADDPNPMENSIDLWADFIRLGVPHHMVMHRIFDNIINMTKAHKQLHDRFRSDNQDDFSAPREPEGPKKLPRLSLRSKALLFELEDDSFEWKLGCIYRTGLLEQSQRLGREEAFHLKCQKVKGSSGKSRSRSNQRSRREREVQDPSEPRSKSADAASSSRDPHGRSHGEGEKFHYDTNGSAFLSSNSRIPADVAWYRLQQYNSRSWKDKIDSAFRFQGMSMKEIRNLFSGADEPPDDVKDDETILSIPNRPGLMSALISDVNLVIDKPFFPFDEYAKFLHKVGKGVPMSTKYSLLVPMSIRLDMGEARVNMRDYPLDMLHVPALRPGQSSRLPSWSLRSNFVIAEEFRDFRSSRQVQLELGPSGGLPDGSRSNPFFINVWRSVSPVKTYSDPTVEINTSLPTSITWCMSYQPVIQDMMKIFEGFTKPEIDPSERVGFWDKIRLSFHSRIRVIWKEGDVHLRLKGSRDPYTVTGFGAGFVMCWRKDVEWDIHTSDDPKSLMTVTSGEYMLAVPDYSHEARHVGESPSSDDKDGGSTPVSSGDKSAALFKKVIMKLSGDVKWVAGLVFERDLQGDKRSFDFKPHYDVVLQNPEYINESQLQVW